MELYAAVRRSVYVEGLSERTAARRFGLARETVRKMLRYRRPPGYRRAQPVRRPKLDAFTGIIDQILREDQSRPKKQRHTAKRIGERLRAEYGFTGGDTIVKAYVRAQRLGGQEMFVPLAHPPGDAQADFGDALVVIAGVDCKAHDLVVDLPHSDDGFVQAFPAETTEAFCDGHNAAFGYFGGVRRPQFSWTRIKGESDVKGGGGHGSVEEGAGSGVGADGGSPEGERSRRRRRGGWGGGLGAQAAVEREPETGRGSAAAARRVAGDGLA